MQKNLFSLEGRIVIVTGSAGNLGIGYTHSLRDAGAVVYAWDNNEKQLSEVFNGDYSESLIPEVVDVTNESEVVQAIGRILRKHEHIDGLINNAALNPAVGVDDGTNLFAPYEEYSIDLFRKEIEANLTSMMITMKSVAPAMIHQKKGSIINVASEVSVAAHDHRVYQISGKYKSPAYSASKTGIIGLTRQWAARLGEHNVRVNAISIGGVKTPNIPEDFAQRFGNMNMLGRMAQMGEYNATMQYLLSDASSFMTAANVVVDGGKTAW